MKIGSEIKEGTLLGGKLRDRQFASCHRTGCEPVLLAASIPARAGDRVLEAGTGAGAGLLCLGWRVPGLSGIGLEVVPELAALANVNFQLNGFESFSARVADVEKPDLSPKFDHALANPPWHGASDSVSPDAARALAHHGRQGLLEHWVRGLSACLKPRGSLTLIIPAAHHGEALSSLGRNGYGAIQFLPLWPRAGIAAKLLIIGARLGVTGPDRILPGFALHEGNKISAAAEAVLRAAEPTELADPVPHSRPKAASGPGGPG
jgi:tRNA1(Val) A37 N6-methylase TrmN6